VEVHSHIQADRTSIPSTISIRIFFTFVFLGYRMSSVSIVRSFSEKGMGVERLFQGGPVQFMGFPAGNDLAEYFFRPFENAIHHEQIASDAYTE
jgi:hypothetical protein